ncbi:MAG: hypothetical protein WA813_25865 [Beijerinckiaceae bacterium]
MDSEVNRAAVMRADGVDSGHAWLRLAAAVVLSTVGNVGLWS